MKTKTITVYEFKDLDKKAREYAKEKYYEIEDYPFLTEDLTASLEDLAPYWKDTKLQYSLGYRQGDGLSFSGELDIEIFLKEKMPQIKRKKVMKEFIYKIYATGNKGHYSYASPKDVAIEFNYQTGKEYKRLEKEAISILKTVQDDYFDLCKKLEKEGYSILEYRMNDDEFQEHCEINEYEFDINGKRI